MKPRRPPTGGRQEVSRIQRAEAILAIMRAHARAFMAEAATVEAAMLAAIRAARLAQEVPVLCALALDHGHSHRAAWSMVAEVTGYSVSTVRRMCERNRARPGPPSRLPRPPRG